MDTGATKALVLSCCRALLRPIARLLLKSGVTWKEFADVSRQSFVEVATSEFGIRGRPTNVSRISILTGLTRREVRRQQQLVLEEPDSRTGYMSKASRVLSAWYQDRDFLDAQGNPRELTVDGTAPSFTELVRRHGGDVPPVALLKELQSAGAVERRRDGTVRALSRVYLPRRLDQARVRLWGSVLEDVGATLEHNLTRDAAKPTRFERRALSVRVARSALPTFRKFLEREGQALLVRIDDWLTAHQASGDGEQAMRLGAGIYHIEDFRSRGRQK